MEGEGGGGGGEKERVFLLTLRDSRLGKSPLCNSVSPL